MKSKIKIDELRNILSKELFYELYVIQKLDYDKLSREFNTTYLALDDLRKEYEISRSRFHYDPNYTSKPTPKTNLTKEEFIELYVNQKMTIDQIAKLQNVTAGAIRYTMQRYGIPARSFRRKEVNEEIVNQMIHLYTNELKSLHEISDITNINYSHVRDLLKESGVIMRDKSNCQVNYQQVRGTFDNLDIDEKSIYQRLRKACGTVIRKLSLQKKFECNYTCEICGASKPNVEIHAHHIIPLNQIFKSILSKNKDKSFEELVECCKEDEILNDINNIKIVCANCHYTIFHPYLHYHGNQQPSLIDEEGSTTMA